MTPAVRVFVEALLLQMAQMRAEIEELKSQVKRLTPQKSSLPPSTQHPHARPTPKPKTKSTKNRGGQQGHRRVVRELVPSERCTEVIELLPETCRRCGESLGGSDPEPLRHQVWELPKIEPLIVEYQRHRLTCYSCGTSTCAELPCGVPTGQFGSTLLAFTGLLMGHFRQSKRRAASFLSDLLNMPCCAAATVKMQNRVSAALEQPYEDLKGLLAKNPNLSMDETPTKQANQKAWLWTAVASNFAVFAIFASRAATALPKLLGDEFRGINNHREWLWTFIEVQGIEPTNNAAERALRPAVIYRKLSFGTQSEAGSRFIERMLTVSETCRLQKRSVFQWLTAAVEANLNNQAAPPLVSAP